MRSRFVLLALPVLLALVLGSTARAAPRAAPQALIHCSTVVVENGLGETSGWPPPFFREYLQLYWCWNNAFVTYCGRARGIGESRDWEFAGWIGWGGTGGAGARYCSLWSQGQWKLSQVGAPDAWCYPHEYVLGYANGTHYAFKSNC
jgi:hypothetical protein